MKEIKAYEFCKKLNKDRFGVKHFIFVVDSTKMEYTLHDRFNLECIFDEGQWKYGIMITKRDVAADNLDMIFRFVAYMMQFCTKIYEARHYEGYGSIISA